MRIVLFCVIFNFLMSCEKGSESHSTSSPFPKLWVFKPLLPFDQRRHYLQLDSVGNGTFFLNTFTTCYTRYNSAWNDSSVLIRDSFWKVISATDTDLILKYGYGELHFVPADTDTGALAYCESNDKWKALWASHNISNYSSDQYQLCNCECWCGGGDTTYSVEVRSDTIYRAINKITGMEKKGMNFYTIQDFFYKIDWHVQRESQLLKVDYDSIYGFPKKIVINMSYYAYDDEYVYTTSNFTKN